MHDDDGWMWGHDWGWNGGIAMGVVMVLLIAALVIALIVAVRYLATPQQGSRQPPGSMSDRSEALLAERFASGEIDEEEYRRRIRVLREHR